MSERALPTVQMLSEVRRHERRGVEVGRETPRNKNTGVQNNQKGIRGEEWRVQLTESAKGQLTESACNRYGLLVWFRVSFDTQYVLCLVSSIV